MTDPEPETSRAREIALPGDAPAGDRGGRWLPGLLAVAGLGLAILGTMPESSWSWTEWRPAPSTFVFAHSTVVLVLTAGAALAMTLTILVLWVGRRRFNVQARKRTEIEATRNEKLILVALTALAFGLAAAALVLHRFDLGNDLRHWQTPGEEAAWPEMPETPPTDTGFLSEMAPELPEWILSVVSTLFFGGMLFTAAMALVLAYHQLRDLARRRGAGKTRAERVASEVAKAAEDGLDDLQPGGDPRAAIIKCYARFERSLAAAETPRAPWETAMEFMRAALGRLPLDPDDVARLTRLFELARFSHHPLGAAEQEAAYRSLVSIRDSLAKRAGDAPAG